MTNTLPIGTRVRVTDAIKTHLSDSRFLGETGTVRGHKFDANEVDFDNSALSNLGTWTADALEVLALPAEEVPARPVVKFSGSSRATAREYAGIANSRVLTAQSRAVFNAASVGHDVDAYQLNEAVLDAMRSASTRCGQSYGRRQLATKIAYLGHIVQAVLEAHADGLPEFDSGLARSRAVVKLRGETEELRSALDAAGALVSNLRTEIDDNHRQAVEEGAALAERLQDAEAQNGSLLKVAEKRDALLAETVEERGVIADVLQYAIGLLDEGNQQRVLGYWDGVKA